MAMLGRVLAFSWRPRLPPSSLLKVAPGRGLATAHTSSDTKCPYCGDIRYYGDGVMGNIARTLVGFALLAILWRHRKCEFVHMSPPPRNEDHDCPELRRCAECASKYPAKRHRCM